jgi:hypothetical protein
MYSQEPATSPFPNLHDSTPHPSSHPISLSHFSVVPSSTPLSSKKFLTFRLYNQNLVHISHLPMHATCLVLLIVFDLIILIIFGLTVNLNLNHSTIKKFKQTETMNA